MRGIRVWIMIVLLTCVFTLPAYAHDESQMNDPEQQREVTRAEYANMLASQLKLEANKEIFYSDTEEHWARDYIGAVCKEGLMAADRFGKFHPEKNLTVQEAAVIMVRVLELETKGLKAPKNRKVASWASPYVAAALNHDAILDTTDYTKPLKFYDAITTMEKIETYITEKEIWKRLRELK